MIIPGVPGQFRIFEMWPQNRNKYILAHMISWGVFIKNSDKNLSLQ